MRKLRTTELNRLDVDEFKYLVKMIRKTEIILGKPKKVITTDEKLNSLAVRKSCVTNINLKKGDIVLKKNISFKRPGTGLNPLDIDQIINKKIKIDLKKNSIIKKTYLL